MISFFEMFDLAKEFYDGVKTGFQHNYWILKNNIQRMSSKRRRNFIRGRRGDSDVNDDFERVDNNIGLQVVGVGFGRTGTVSIFPCRKQFGNFKFRLTMSSNLLACCFLYPVFFGLSLEYAQLSYITHLSII